MTIEHLERQLLQLPVEERARIAKRLIESLDDPTDEVDEAAIEAAWMVEIERRVEELERGEAETIPAEEVFARLRKRFSL